MMFVKNTVNTQGEGTSMRVEMHVNICMCVTRVQTSRTPGSPERVGARPSTARGMVAVWSGKF